MNLSDVIKYKIPNNPEILNILHSREMRIENLINKFRMVLLTIISILDIIVMTFYLPVTTNAKITEVFSLFATFGLFVFVHKMTQGNVYRPWVKYLTITADVLGSLIYAYTVVFVQKMPFPIQVVEFYLIFSIMFLFFNILCILRANKKVIVYCVVITLLANTALYVSLGVFTMTPIYTGVFIIIFGVFNLWGTVQILQNIVANFKLGVVIDDLKVANAEILQQKEEITAQRDEIYQQKEEITTQRDEIEEKSNILQEAYKTIEIKNHHILSSINYAKFIQDAILPEQKFIKAQFPESFVLFMPKDVVSGDFYWFKNLQDEVIFAAIDCTGHGVPGAFMSILAYNFLNQAVNEKHIKEPHEIIKYISSTIIETLRNESGKTTVKDGMDIVVCRYIKSNNSIAFSGVRNSLFLLRNYEIIEYKTDETPIGEVNSSGIISYNMQLINLNDDDRIYLFSDGFIDQFGGKDGKKLLKKRFKDMLLLSKNNTMEEQRTFLKNEFIQWKGNFEQIDDVLIMGIKF